MSSNYWGYSCRLGIWGLALIGILAAGCAPAGHRATVTELTAQSENPTKPPTYQRVLIQFPVQDLKTRQDAENGFAAYASANAIDAQFLPSHQVFFPGKIYSPDEITQTLKERRIGAVLVVAVSGSGLTPVYVPKQSYTWFGATHARSLGGADSTGVSATVEQGGYYDSAPWASFEIRLIDVSDSETVWYATANSGGNRNATYRDFIDPLSHRVLHRLVMDGHLQFEPPSPDPESSHPNSPQQVRAESPFLSEAELLYVTGPDTGTYPLEGIRLPSQTRPACAEIRQNALARATELASDPSVIVEGPIDGFADRTKTVAAHLYSKDGHDLGLALLEQGLVIGENLFTGRKSYAKYALRYAAAQASAKRRGVGVWGAGCVIPLQ